MLDWLRYTPRQDWFVARLVAVVTDKQVTRAIRQDLLGELARIGDNPVITDLFKRLLKNPVAEGDRKRAIRYGAVARSVEGQRFLWARFLDRSLAPKERIAALRSYESNSKRLTRNAALRGTLRGLLWNETETRAFREKLAEYVQLRSGSRIDDTLRLAVESVTSDIGN